MSNKSTISNLEHKLLFVASSIVPLLIISDILLRIYNSYFPSPPPPPLPNESGVYMSACHFPTFLEKAFLISFFSGGFLTSIFVFSRRIFQSWFVLFFPLITFTVYFTEAAFSYFKNIVKIEGATPPDLIDIFPQAVLILGGITIFQFLWHTKVIIQDRIRDKNLNLNLP